MFVVVGNEEKEMESMIYFEDNTYSSNQSSECKCINCSCRKDEFIWRKVKIIKAVVDADVQVVLVKNHAIVK